MSGLFIGSHYPIQLENLPLGWKAVYLGSVVIDAEPGFASGKHNQYGNGILHLRPMNINRSGRLDLEDAKYVDEDNPKRLRAGDVVFNNTNSPALVGKTALVNTSTELAYSNHMTRLRSAPGVSSEFIAHQLHFLWMAGYFLHNCTHHVNQASISTKVLTQTVPFVLPPTREQERIVGEIEKHLTRLDAAVASLQRVEANLKRYRAAVLKAACEGRLVPTEAESAREEGRGYEPADQLIRRTQQRSPFLSPELLPPIPEGWAWASIGDLFYVSVGATPSRQRPEFWGGDIAWVSSGEIAFCRIRKTRERITEEGLEHTSTECHPPGTVLLAMIGEGRTRGQAALLDVNACNNQNSAAIRVAETEIEPEYVYYFLWSEYERTRRLGSGNNQPALNKSRVQAIPIPIPPLAEQQRMVEELERQLSVLDGLNATVQASLRRAKVLRDLVLRRAFQGRLVPQDPNDEPASVLLERIRQARASQSPEPRPKKKERTNAAPAPLAAAPPPVRAEKPLPAAEPAPEPPELDYLDFPRDEQREVVWETLFGQGALAKHEAIRTAAEGLRDQGFARFKRLRQDGPLYGAIAAAIERGVREGSFDRPRRGAVRAVLGDAKEYTIEDWQRCLLAVAGDEPAEVEDTLRTAAEWARETMGLEFARLREDGVILTGLREALEEAVRAGELMRRGTRVRRR